MLNPGNPPENRNYIAIHISISAANQNQKRSASPYIHHFIILQFQDTPINKRETIHRIEFYGGLWMSYISNSAPENLPTGLSLHNSSKHEFLGFPAEGTSWHLSQPSPAIKSESNVRTGDPLSKYEKTTRKFFSTLKLKQTEFHE